MYFYNKTHQFKNSTRLLWLIPSATIRHVLELITVLRDHLLKTRTGKQTLTRCTWPSTSILNFPQPEIRMKSSCCLHVTFPGHWEPVHQHLAGLNGHVSEEKQESCQGPRGYDLYQKKDSQTLLLAIEQVVKRFHMRTFINYVISKYYIISLSYELLLYCFVLLHPMKESWCVFFMECE